MTTPSPIWERHLRDEFIAWLLPASSPTQSDVEQAAAFLEAWLHTPDVLRTLRSLGFVRSSESTIVRWATEELPSLVKRLPTTSVRVRERRRGAWRGRLDVEATLKRRLAGDLETTVLRRPRRRLDLPQNVLVRTVSDRMLALLTSLRQQKFLLAAWAAPLADAENGIRHALRRSRLSEVPPAPHIEPSHLEAARYARHPAYDTAAELWAKLRPLDGPPRAADASLIAEGALWPDAPDKRFELATLLRLLRALAAATVDRQPTRWTLRRAPARSSTPMASLLRDDGARIDVWLDQAVLKSPTWEDLGGHYLRAGPPRPDITVRTRRTDGSTGAFVVECKLSANPAYHRVGLHEALFYAEHLEGLLPWPRAALVTSEGTIGAPRMGDPVVAQVWADWPWHPLVEAIVGSLDTTRPPRSLQPPTASPR